VSIEKRRSTADIFAGYLEDLKEEFEEWKREFIEKPSWNQKASTMEPLHNVTVTSTEVVVTVDLPFTRKSTLRVKPLDESTLEISAGMKRKMTFREMGITHHEAEFQRFHCCTQVPVPVQMGKMRIRFKKGMLEVHLPRRHARSETKQEPVPKPKIRRA
jgi:HSP20 family molecular chaperone IbpA